MHTRIVTVYASMPLKNIMLHSHMQTDYTLSNTTITSQMVTILIISNSHHIDDNTLITWYLLVELKGISHTLGYCERHFSADITCFSKYLSKADSEASPMVALCCHTCNNNTPYISVILTYPLDQHPPVQ